MTTPPVLLTMDDGLATITLHRPEAMNSLNVATKVLLRDTVAQVAADPEVRCVVLTGAGRAFCVGQDLKEHAGILRARAADPEGPELFSTVTDHYNPTVAALVAMPKPVIAAVNGVAAGAGASLAFACDLRILAAGAGFNLAFANVALSCDTGSSWTLPRLVGHAKALELLYFPRTLGAEEALSLGLANRVVSEAEFASTVHDLARRLADGPTLAFGAMRRSVSFAAEHHFTESLAFEAQRMAETGESFDHSEAVDAFLSKRAARFTGS